MAPSPPAAPGLILALGSATCFGFNIVYARIASFSGVTGSTLVLYRVLIMLALVAVVAAAFRRGLQVAPGERRSIFVLSLCTALVGICYLSSVAYIPVGVAAVVFYTFPVLIVLASPLVDGTRLTASLLGIVATAVIGAVLVVGPVFQELDWRGLALAAAASVTAAVQFFTATRCRKTSSVAKVLWVHALVLPTAILVGLASESLSPPSSLLLAPVAVVLTIGGYILGFLLQMIALARISAVVAGVVFCLEPVVAALTSALVLGETLSLVQMIGGALVLAAIMTNVILDRRRPTARLPITEITGPA